MSLVSNSFQETIDALGQGKPCVFPTDTVYGLGLAVAKADNPKILYEIKRRETGKPIAWLVGGPDDLLRYGEQVPAFAHVLAQTFWPGALTLVVAASYEVPPSYRSAKGTIGLRMPANDVVLQLIREVGCPLATSSANISGTPSVSSFSALDPLLVQQAAAVLADTHELDESGVASTVVDCTGGHPIVVREGGISVADIEALS